MEQKALTGYLVEMPGLIRLLIQADVSAVSLCTKELKPKRIPESLFEELMREH